MPWGNVLIQLLFMGHAARKPNGVMVKQLLFAHSIPGHSRPIVMALTSHGWTPPCITWAAMPHTADRPFTRLDKPTVDLNHNIWRGVVSRC